MTFSLYSKIVLKLKIIQSSPLLNLFPKTPTLRSKQKLATVSRETQEYPRNGQSQNSSAPRITEEYIAQVSEEIEGRVTRKLSQEFSRTKSHILGALSKLDNLFLNPQARTFSGTVPGTFRNADVENQELHSEVDFCLSCQQPNWLRPGWDLSQLYGCDRWRTKGNTLQQLCFAHVCSKNHHENQREQSESKEYSVFPFSTSETVLCYRIYLNVKTKRTDGNKTYVKGQNTNKFLPWAILNYPWPVKTALVAYSQSFGLLSSKINRLKTERIKHEVANGKKWDKFPIMQYFLVIFHFFSVYSE